MRWTSEEEQTAISMRTSGSTVIAIAKKLNRTHGSVRRLLERQANGHASKMDTVAIEILEEERVCVPDEVIADRERRLSAPKTLIMIIFVDPLPSQSALHRQF